MLTEACDPMVRPNWGSRHTEGPKRFKTYKEEFEGYRLDQLRISPNLLQLLTGGGSRPLLGGAGLGGGGGGDEVEDGTSWDVFLSYSKLDSQQAVAQGEVDLSELPPSYDEVVRQAMDPRVLKEELRAMGFSVWCVMRRASLSIVPTPDRPVTVGLLISSTVRRAPRALSSTPPTHPPTRIA